jgi:hypothetical protein
MTISAGRAQLTVRAALHTVLAVLLADACWVFVRGVMPRHGLEFGDVFYLPVALAAASAVAAWRALGAWRALAGGRSGEAGGSDGGPRDRRFDPAARRAERLHAEAAAADESGGESSVSPPSEREPQKEGESS